MTTSVQPQSGQTQARATAATLGGWLAVFARADDVPSPTPLPSPPADFKPLNKSETSSLRKPYPDQVTLLPAVVTEITKLVTTGMYTVFFGDRVPSNVILSMLARAGAWQAAAAIAERWNQYVQDKRMGAWDDVFTVTAIFAPEVSAALVYDPTRASQLTETTAFLNAKSTSAQQAAARKKKNVKAAAKTGNAPVVTPAPSPGSSPGTKT